MHKKTETDIKKDFDQFMILVYPKYYYWKTWGNGIERKGRADILGLTDKGQFLAVELKNGKNKLSDEQQRFLISAYMREGIASATNNPYFTFTLILCKNCQMKGFGNLCIFCNSYKETGIQLFKEDLNYGF